MPEATVIAVAASSQAAVATYEAKKAEKISCINYINTYNPKASPEEMRTYANCVQLVYPDPERTKFTDLDIMTFKIIAISAVIGAFVGFVLSFRQQDRDYGVVFGMTFLGFLCPPIVLFFGFLIFLLIRFIVS